MKCPHCGSPIGLEDHYCTFCGAKNTLAQEHQKDMKHYRTEFKKTQTEVLSSSHHLKRFFSSFLVICIFVIIVFLSYAFSRSAWKIGSYITEKEINAHYDEHLQNLKQFMEADDYLGFYHYYDSNSLSFSDNFRSFIAVNDAASSYYYVFRFIMNLTEDPDYLENDTAASSIKTMVSNLNSIFNIEDYYHYNQEKYYTEENLKFIHDIQNDVKLFLVTYFHLTQEQAETFSDLSQKAQTDLLERSLLDP